MDLRFTERARRVVMRAVLAVSVMTIACSSSTPVGPTSTAIGPSGGSVSAVGAQITVPAGALNASVAITLQQGSAITQSGFQTAGPAVTCGPSGTVFAVPVTLALPVTLPPGASITSVVVLKRDAGGVTALTPIARDAAAGTVTVHTSSFSDFQAQVPVAVTYTGSVTSGGSGTQGMGNMGQIICRCPVAFSATISMSLTTLPDGSIQGTVQPVISRAPGNVASCTNYVPGLNPQACDSITHPWSMFTVTAAPTQPLSGTVSDIRWTVSDLFCGTVANPLSSVGATFTGGLQGDAIVGTVSVSGSCLPAYHNDISGSFPVTLRR